MSFRRLIFLVAVALVAIVGVAMAAKGGGGKVSLCAAGDGSLRAPKSGACGKGERRLSVSTKGSPGAAGAPGAPGAAGAPGSPGALPSLAPSTTLVGAAGPDCATTPVFCSSAKGSWGNFGEGFAPVGFQVGAAGGVHLQGMAKPSYSGGDFTDRPIFYLPPGLRPPALLTIAVRACDETYKRITLRSDGAVEASDLVCVPLDGIVFHP